MSWSVRSDQNVSEFAHYGVKGMKWGVRRTPEELGHQQEIRESVKGNVNLAKELFGDPIVKLPRPKLRNEKANYYVNKGIDYLEPYMSPKGIAFLAVSAIVPGFGIGTILAGQAAIDTGLADAALAGLTAKELKHSYEGGDILQANELTHYGVLGMRWGVRRTPEQLGHHTVKRGTLVRRTTAAENEAGFKGSAYVTYLPPDRDLYRGAWSDVMRRNYGLNKGDRLFETSYKLKEDLNIPSREEQIEVVNKLRGDEALTDVKRLSETYIKMTRIKKEDWVNKAIIAGDPRSEKELASIYDDWAKALVAKSMSDYRNMTSDEFFRSASSLFGVDTVSRQKVIDELSKRGYNAMVDQASVGNQTHREGVDPLIVFDREKTLEKVETRSIGKLEESMAKNRYMNWYKTANSPIFRKNPW